MNAKTTKITKTLSGGQAAVEALRNEKTEYVFGLIGSATMEMFDALYDADDIKFIGIHDERTGTHMADGYAEQAEKPELFWPDKMARAQPIWSLAWRRLKQHTRLWYRLQGRCLLGMCTVMHFKKSINKHFLSRLPKKHGRCRQLIECQKFFVRLFERLWHRAVGQFM